MLIAIAYGNVYKICYVCNYFGTSFAIRVTLQAAEFAWNISPKA